MKTTLKKVIVGSPVEKMARKLHALAKGYNFENSESYWENRYKKRGNSGAGSYGRLALFKADILNSYVKEHNVQSVLNMAAGTGIS